MAFRGSNNVPSAVYKLHQLAFLWTDLIGKVLYLAWTNLKKLHKYRDNGPFKLLIIFVRIAMYSMNFYAYRVNNEELGPPLLSPNCQKNLG